MAMSKQQREFVNASLDQILNATNVFDLESKIPMQQMIYLTNIANNNGLSFFNSVVAYKKQLEMLKNNVKLATLSFPHEQIAGILNFLPSLEVMVTPRVVYSWISDCIMVDMEDDYWWNSSPYMKININYFLALLYRASMKLTEMGNLQASFRQIFISLWISSSHGRNHNEIVTTVKDLMEKHGFTYIYLGHGKVGKFELQDNNVYRVTLYGAINPLFKRKIPDGHYQYASTVQLQNVTMADLERETFFISLKYDKNGIPLLSKSYDLVAPDAKVDHQWQSPNYESHFHSTIRSIMQDIAGSVHKARLLHYEMAREMIGALNRGTHLKYSSDLDHAFAIKRLVVSRLPGKLFRQFLWAKSPEEFQMMILIMQIQREDILRFLEESTGDKSLQSEAESLAEEWKRLAKPFSRIEYPLNPAELFAVQPKIRFPSKEIIKLIADWKGFSVSGYNSISLDDPVHVTAVPLLLTHTDLCDIPSVNLALSYLFNNPTVILAVDHEVLRKLLWNPQANYQLAAIPFHPPGPWLDTLLKCGYDADKQIYSPTTITILKAYVKGTEYLEDPASALATIKAALQPDVLTLIQQ